MMARPTRSLFLRLLAGWSAIILPSPPASGAEAELLTYTYERFGDPSQFLQYSFTNNDPGAEYHSAEFDLAASIGTLLQQIAERDPNHSSASEILSKIANDQDGLGVSIDRTFGDVSADWLVSLDPDTGRVCITNNDGRGVDTWTSTPHQDTLVLRVSLGTLLDFNQNGLIDPDERLELVPWAPAQAGFVAYFGATGIITAPAPRVRLAAPPDADGDGWSDAAEAQVFATRPDAAGSAPRPRLSLDGPDLLVEVPHQAGHTWRLERSPDAATWLLQDGAPLSPDADYTFAEATGWTTLRLPGSAPAEFFRIRYR